MEARDEIRRTNAGLVLASGMSRRFGPANKLLATVDGEAILRRTVHPYLAAGLAPVIVVVGHEAERIIPTLEVLPVQLVRNPDFREGQSRALVRGVSALPADVRAVVIGVGDQPLLTVDVIEALIGVYRRTRAPIVAPRYGGKPGNPVVFDRRVFPELLAITGDQGGRSVVRNHDDTVWVDVDISAHLDIDTEEDLRRACEGGNHPSAQAAP